MKKLISLFLIFYFNCFAQVMQAQGPVQLKPFTDKTGFVFMPDSMECTALKSTDGNYRETQCDYTVLWNSKLDGIHIVLRNHTWGDYAYLTVRHTLAGEVGRFGQKIMFNDEKQDQEWIKTSYDAQLSTGLILRLHYFTKNTVNDVDMIVNWSFHKIVP